MKKYITVLIGIIIFLSPVNSQIYITNDTVKLDPISIISPIVINKHTPFSFTNITNEEISKYSSSEPAVLFSHTPSVSFYSDNGSGTGYTYFRLRGIDQTRINSTFNGVPLNEPEDQGIYYNNFPGFLNNLSSVQIIRGAGISKPGISCYGGSINFMPSEFSETPQFSINGVYGSYNTYQLHTGINTPNFFINASLLTTDGYKENVFNKSWSSFYGTNLNIKKHNIKLYGFIGHQINGMGWLGEPIDSIMVNRRYNSNNENETDEFLQVHNQINWIYRNLTTTLYHTYLNGGYGIDGVHYGYTGIDTVKVQSNWIGTNVNYLIQLKPVFFLNIGTSAYTYYREHEGDNSFYYYNVGYKNNISPYAKAEFKIKDYISIYGDVQYRFANLSYKGDSIFPTQYYNFLNYSGGINVKINKYTKIYYGIGKTYKEPKRYDYFGGYEYYMPTYYTALVPEELLSNELGVRYLDNRTIVNVNFYYMKFKNEMALTGNLGYNAISLSNVNIDKSFRSGIEIDASYDISNSFNINTSSAFSYNQIQEGDFIGKPVLTPMVITNLDFVYKFRKLFYIGCNLRYNGKSYIDFYNENILPSYTLINMYSGLSWKHLEIKVNLNNVTDELILGSAYMNWDNEPRYYVMSGRNILVNIMFKL